MDPVQGFMQAIADAGLTPPDVIRADGRLTRFNGTGKRRNERNSWYVLYLDGVPSGSFGDWGLQLTAKWCSKSDNEMSPAEKQALRDHVKAAQKQRDQEAAQRQVEAAATAASMWRAAIPAATHPYLTTKLVKAYGLRSDGHNLLIPMRNSSGELCSLQTIDADGDKRFLFGGRVKACYHSIGRPSGRLIVCEGYATGATIHEATSDAVAVAFNAGNLEPVARALREKYPCLSIVIAADDDYMVRDQKTGGPFNPGVSAAKQAAAAVGGLVAVPNFAGLPRGPGDSDYNDLARLSGRVNLEVPA